MTTEYYYCCILMIVRVFPNNMLWQNLSPHSCCCVFMVTVLMGYRHLKLRKIRYRMILKVEIEGYFPFLDYLDF